MLTFPLYHRAFPTQTFYLSRFWHSFGALISIAFVVYFSLPAAFTAGAYRKEVEEGTLDVLSTVPGVRRYHSMISWCLCCALWTILSALPCWVFFTIVLGNPILACIPVVCMTIFGISLGK